MSAFCLGDCNESSAATIFTFEATSPALCMSKARFQFAIVITDSWLVLMRKVLYPSVKSSLSARRAALELSPAYHKRRSPPQIHRVQYPSKCISQCCDKDGKRVQNTIGAVADILPPMAAVAVCAMPMVMAALNVCESSE